MAVSFGFIGNLSEIPREKETRTEEKHGEKLERRRGKYQTKRLDDKLRLLKKQL